MSTDAHCRELKARRFSRFAQGLVLYLLAVILFGAWVRITGSGAGCGESWPTCHGRLVPHTESQKTWIEFAHRVSSGLLGPVALALPVWAWRIFPRGHGARWASLATLILIGVEGALGAGLVLGGLVAEDDSLARALAVALHLGNTLLLMACAVLTAAYARSARAYAELATRRLRTGSAVLLVGLATVSSLGAVTALGDTLFPVGSRAAAQAGASHFLVQLRVVHPVLATGVALLGLWLGGELAQVRGLEAWARGVALLSGGQLVVGIVNIAFGAPGGLQLLHLLLAQSLWMAAVILGVGLYGGSVLNVSGPKRS